MAAAAAQTIRRLQISATTALGPYIVDFYCHEARLIVEIDGDSHAFQEAYDAQRTAWLEAEGNRVIRFWNVTVMKNLEWVLQTIQAACAQSSLSTPTGKLDNKFPDEP